MLAVQKLSTGVDARNIPNIVLMRPVNSMSEFKQIIGRGTRLFEEKTFLPIMILWAPTINSPLEWDGEQVEEESREERKPKPLIEEQ